MTHSSEGRYAVADPTSPATTGNGSASGDSMTALTPVMPSPTHLPSTAPGPTLTPIPPSPTHLPSTVPGTTSTPTPPSPTHARQDASSARDNSETVTNLSRAVAALADTVRMLTEKLGSADPAVRR